MKRLVLALALFGTALGANAALLLRSDPAAEVLSGSVEISLSNRKITVPRALIRDRAQMAGGRLDRLDLAMGIPDFSPIPQPSARDPNQPMPDRLSLVLRATSADTPDAMTLFQTVYARFLARETWSNPGGLVMRRFRQGTPYEDRELYIGAGGRQIFIALCPQERASASEQPQASAPQVSLRDIEPCTMLLRQGGLDAEVRFNARHLPEWRKLTAASLDLMTKLGGNGAEAAPQ